MKRNGILNFQSFGMKSTLLAIADVAKPGEATGLTVENVSGAVMCAGALVGVALFPIDGKSVSSSSELKKAVAEVNKSAAHLMQVGSSRICLACAFFK